MTSRIYTGHLRRYEKWCNRNNQVPEYLTTLETYRNDLLNERCLTRRYIKAAIAVIKKKWFTHPDNIPKPNLKKNRKTSNATADPAIHKTLLNKKIKSGEVQIKRAMRTFTHEEYRKIMEASYQNYQRNEVALLMILLAHRPDLRPQQIFQFMNDMERRADFINTLPSSEENFIVFVKTVLANIKQVFPRKHNTYLVKLKRYLKLILGRDVPEASFEMLRRTRQILTKRDEMVKDILEESKRIAAE